MGRLVQIRQVPEPVHRILKARAAQSGSSLSEYLRTELGRLAALPTSDELRARMRSRSVVKVREQPEAIVRRARESDR